MPPLALLVGEIIETAVRLKLTLHSRSNHVSFDDRNQHGCVFSSHFSILLISLEVKYLASEIAASGPSAQKYLDLKTSSDNEKLLKRDMNPMNPFQNLTRILFSNK